MKFDIKNLVMAAEDVVDPDKQTANTKVKCILCGTAFKTAARYPVQRHYESKHKYSFPPERGVKRVSESPLEQVNVKVNKCDIPKLNFTARGYIRTCVKLHVRSNLSANYWNSPETRAFHHIYEKSLNVSVSGEMMKEHINSVYNELSDKFRVLQGRLFSLKLDIVSRERRSFLGVSIQFANDFQIEVIHLGMIELQAGEKAENIKMNVQQMITKHGLQLDQVYACTTDNGGECINGTRTLISNPAADALTDEEDDETEEDWMDSYDTADQNAEIDITRLIEGIDFGFECNPIRCVTNTVQLAVHDVLKIYNKIIEDIRKQIISGPLPVRLPLRRKVTRWSSTFEMLEGFLRVRDKFVGEMADQQWKLIEDLVRALNPMHTMTKKLQTVQLTVGDLVYDFWKCKNDLEKLGSRIAEELLAAVRVHEKTLMDNPHITAVIYMDPRLCNSDNEFISFEAKCGAVNFLVSTNERITRLRRDCGLIQQAADVEGSPKVPGVGVLLPLKRRLEKLQAMAVPLAEFDILSHWQRLMKNDPEVADLAAVVLALPASKVSFERTLTTTRQILSQFPRFLNPKSERLQKLLFLKSNLNNINNKCVDPLYYGLMK